MEFQLTYRGPLYASGDPKHKHQIRQHFHKQLQILWNQKPLVAIRNRYTDPKSDSRIIETLGDFNFVPLVCQKLKLVCELKIDLLRPEEPGQIITQTGDIDNRLKTLFDALQMPNADQIAKIKPSEDENPFYCLLEDDNLIIAESVITGRLIEPDVETSDVQLLIHVTTKSIVATALSTALL